MHIIKAMLRITYYSALLHYIVFEMAYICLNKGTMGAFAFARKPYVFFLVSQRTSFACKQFIGESKFCE